MPFSWVKMPSNTSRKIRECAGDDRSKARLKACVEEIVASDGGERREHLLRGERQVRARAHPLGHRGAEANIIFDLEATESRRPVRGRGDRRPDRRAVLGRTDRQRQGRGQPPRRNRHSALHRHRRVDQARPPARRRATGTCSRRTGACFATPSPRTTGSRSTRRATRSSSPSAARTMPSPLRPTRSVRSQAPTFAIRIGIHTGEPTLADGGYYVGVDLSRAARICAAAHGGQVPALARDPRSRRPTTSRSATSASTCSRTSTRPSASTSSSCPGLAQRFPPPRASSPGNLPRTRTRLLRPRDASSTTIRAPARRRRAGRHAHRAGRRRQDAARARGGARAASDAFDDGAFFVSLAAARASDVLRRARADARGRPSRRANRRRRARTVASSRARCCSCSTTSSRRSTAAPQVATLVERCPRLKVLATSRERLHLGAEHEYRLDPLADADAADLFAARASAARPDLDIDAQRDVVDAICKQLDGLPLALELAAARARILPLATILDRLERAALRSSPAAPATCPSASARSPRRSTGATPCSTRRSRQRFSASRSSSAARRSRRSRASSRRRPRARARSPHSATRACF